MLALPALILSHVFKTGTLLSVLMILPAYLLVGYDVLWNAIRDIGHGQLFGEKFLMSIATIGALALGETLEAVAVMLFFQIGELFESMATAGARRNLSALAALCPDEAIVLQNDEEVILPVDEVPLGSLTVIPAGARVPLDGVIVSGDADFDYSSLTGESVPVYRKEGDSVPSGVLSLNARVTVRTTHTAENASTSRILALMEEATSKKARHERFITRFSAYYTPCVVLAALLVAFVLPLAAGGSYLDALPRYLHRALTFLVISCPCALVISVPLSFFGAVGAAARKGIIFKSNAALETLASAKVAFFDKTGTLTEGEFVITSVILAENTPVADEQALLVYAAAAESVSTHPLARAITAAASFDKAALGETNELRGKGVCARYQNHTILCGNASFIEKATAGTASQMVLSEKDTVVYVALDGQFAGVITLADRLKDSASDLFEKLHALRVEGIILSGDRASTVEEVGRTLGADGAFGSLLPADKVQKVQEASPRGVTVFAGDGINDAPVLAAAGVSFAMGGIGSDAAVEASDAVITDDNPEKVAWAIALSRFSLTIVKQNIVFALVVKFAILFLGALGLAGMWLAVFADVGVSVLAILNASRTLHFDTKLKKR